MYLTTTEVADFLRVSRDKIESLCRSGELKALKLGTAKTSPYRIAEGDLQDYIARAAEQAKAAS